MFLDIRAACGPVHKSALCHYLLRDGVPGKCVSSQKRRIVISGRVRSYSSTTKLHYIKISVQICHVACSTERLVQSTEPHYWTLPRKKNIATISLCWLTTNRQLNTRWTAWRLSFFFRYDMSCTSKVQFISSRVAGACACTNSRGQQLEISNSLEHLEGPFQKVGVWTRDHITNQESYSSDRKSAIHVASPWYPDALKQWVSYADCKTSMGPMQQRGNGTSWKMKKWAVEK